MRFVGAIAVLPRISNITRDVVSKVRKAFGDQLLFGRSATLARVLYRNPFGAFSEVTHLRLSEVTHSHEKPRSLKLTVVVLAGMVIMG